MTEIPPAASSPQPVSISNPPPKFDDVGRPSTPQTTSFRQSKIGIAARDFVFLSIATACVLVLTFSFKNYRWGTNALSAYIHFCLFYSIYAYAGIRRCILIYVVPFAFLYLELTTPLLSLFIYIFRIILPGSLPAAPTFLNTFSSMFFGAGLMEELMKAVPALFGLAIAMRPLPLTETPTKPYLGLFRCSTPLEGILLGVAAGAGFSYVESVYLFVPDNAQYVANTALWEGNFVNEIRMLLPRILHGAIGHMCWAGTAGYFIGLSARYPKSMIKLLAIGWLLPAILHAFWNASPYLGEIGRWARAGFSLLAFFTCFVMATRQTPRWQAKT
jgi:RsiW-degrading membrane proteinase PrsW (M82 family)